MDEQIGHRLSKWSSTKSLSKIKSESRHNLKIGLIWKTKQLKTKIFYIFVFSVLSCSSVITTYNAINDYLKYDVVSQTRIVSDQPSLFPKITICSTVTFPTIKASSLIVDIIKRVFNQDFSDYNNMSRVLKPEDFLTYLEIANIISVSEVSN